MKRIISMILNLVLAFSLVPSAYAASDEAMAAANALHEQGLFNGVGTDKNGNPIFDLDRTPTRAEGVTMLVRLLGKEKEAKNGVWSMPFTDVANWAKPYIGYAYQNGLTNGVSSTRFDGSGSITASQYITFVLRALGYTSGTDFKWNAAWELSDKLGITSGQYNAGTTKFTRGDVAIISYNSLSAKRNVAVTGVTLNKSSLSMTTGESATLTATISPQDATNQNITWSSSDTKVVTVSGGKVTALATGTATITAKCGSKAATCTVIVTAKPISYSGTGDKVISNINIPAGSYYAEYTHSGRRNFISKLYYGSQSYDYFRISNEIGDCSGQVALYENKNTAVTNGMLEVKADGKWTIRFIPVSGTTTTNIKGHGEVVTGLFTAKSSRYVVSMTHNGEHNFIAKAIKYNGKNSYDYESLVNEIGTYSGQKVINLEVGQKYFLYVRADGNWTFDFGQGDAVTTYAPPAVPSSSGDKNDGDTSNPGPSDSKPQEPTGSGIETLVSYIDSHGRTNNGYRYIQETKTVNGTKVVSTITHRNDKGLLIFHCDYDNGCYISFDYDIETQSAVSQISVNGIGGSAFNTCKADFDISSYTQNTNLTFEKQENSFATFPTSYNEEANRLVQIAVPAWGLLVADTAGVSFNSIGFHSYP